MKINSSIQTLLLAVILILAGINSPNNGFDDRVTKSSFDMLLSAFEVIILIVSINLIWITIENYRKTTK